MEAVSISNALFSKVQQRVLALIFGHPERSFYTSEIVRSVDSGTGAVERELSRLQRSGLVSVERVGNQKHYRANRQSPVFKELQGLVVASLPADHASMRGINVAQRDVIIGVPQHLLGLIEDARGLPQMPFLK